MNFLTQQKEIEKEIKECKDCKICGLNNPRYPICDFHQGQEIQLLTDKKMVKEAIEGSINRNNIMKIKYSGVDEIKVGFCNVANMELRELLKQLAISDEEEI